MASKTPILLTRSLSPLKTVGFGGIAGMGWGRGVKIPPKKAKNGLSLYLFFIYLFTPFLIFLHFILLFLLYFNTLFYRKKACKQYYTNTPYVETCSLLLTLLTCCFCVAGRLAHYVRRRPFPSRRCKIRVPSIPARALRERMRRHGILRHGV